MHPGGRSFHFAKSLVIAPISVKEQDFYRNPMYPLSQNVPVA